MTERKQVRKYRKILQEYPFVLHPIFVRSRTEVEEDWAQGHLSVEEFVTRAKQNLDLPAESWERADAYLARKQASEVKNLKGWYMRTAPWINAHKRLITVCASIIVIITLFFTVVPAGRALAAEIASFVARVFGNRIEITREGEFGYADVIEPEKEYGVTQYNSIEEFITAVGYKPFVLDMDWLRVEKVEYEVAHAGDQVYISYAHSNMPEIVKVLEIYNIDELMIKGNVESLENQELIELADGAICYSVQDPVDQLITTTIIFREKIIFINSHDDWIMDEILEHFKG